tara:strand:+ start:257 stop:436 length:180 start_codon:yes stop_codon:yes gene_type:complete
MGRKVKYNTKTEKQDAQRRWQMEHYHRNKERLRKLARDRYRKKRQQQIEDQRRKELYGE